MAINENNSQKTQKENLESEEYNNSKEKHQFFSYDNKFLNINTNNNMNSNKTTNKSVQFLKEKYIIDKVITKDIIIDKFDESIDLPIKIIYDNHIYILTSNKPKDRKKVTFKCILWLKIKDKTSNNYNFCSSTIKCKINKNKELKFFLVILIHMIVIKLIIY